MSDLPSEEDWKANNEAQIARMKKWIERLRGVRIFRPIVVDAEIDGWNNARLSVTITDGLTTVKTAPFSFHVPTTKFKDLYERLEDEIVECVKALVREKTAPELVVLGMSPVTVERETTDGEEYLYRF